MKRIGLISDTHGYLHKDIAQHFKNCDEIWHAGDFGSINWISQLNEQLSELNSTPFMRGVFGNIDSTDIRTSFPERLIFTCEKVKVMIQHVGGYPGKYASGVKKILHDEEVKLFISGHSHILKVMYDETVGCLHMNPGAAGQQGWHKVKTIIRFIIDENDIKDCEVIELS